MSRKPIRQLLPAIARTLRPEKWRYSIKMKIGVYVDAFNLYYGGRGHCGRSVPGWRWLDVRKFAEGALATYLSKAQAEGWGGLATWQTGTIERVVYCTAPIAPSPNSTAHHDQDTYMRALLSHGSVDHIEKGYYQRKTKVAPLAVKNGNQAPTIVSPAWPIQIQDSTTRTPVSDAIFLVSYLHTEEKGSDVNVGTHLLKDMFEGVIDAAVVISNDSDLRLPIEIARSKIPVGVISPGTGYVAGALKHGEEMTVSCHWNWKVAPIHFTANQMPEIIGPLVRPTGW